MNKYNLSIIIYLIFLTVSLYCFNRVHQVPALKEEIQIIKNEFDDMTTELRSDIDEIKKLLIKINNKID